MASRTVPRTATKASGQLITGALWNAGPYALGNFLLNVPMFRGRQNTSQSIANGTYTALNLDVTDVDTDSGHSNVTNNTRYTCQVAGWYWVEGYVAFPAGGSSGRLVCAVAKNGTYVTASEQFLERTSDLQSCSASALVQLSTGDYVEIWGQQGSGVSLSTFIGTDLDCCMNLFWVHS